MKRLTLSLLWILLTLNSLPSLFAQEKPWPRTVLLNQGTVTIYAPQVDALDDDIIRFRSALAYRADAKAEPVFGAGWFESPVVIDSARGTVHPASLKVTETRFPEGTADIQPELAMVLALQSPHWNLEMPLAEIDESIRTARLEAQSVSTRPPKIIYRDHPALLITIDGDPVLREVENSSLKAVVNTPYPLIYDGRYYYLNAAKDVWYQSSDATGPYRLDTRPPAKVAAMVQPDNDAVTDTADVGAVTAGNAPEIVVSTEPAELIVTDGPAAFVPLVDDLLVLQNSDDDVFMDVGSQAFYVVLAGRWYRSVSLNGPWAYQPANELPAAFARIPQDSNQADSRVYVAGTEEAKEAVLDAQVPQTAAVQRGVVDIDVQYDGDPVYQPVDGTDLVYIRNTGSTVLVSDGLYYLVQDGVWYLSTTPNGPWQVSDYRPAQVDRILPTSPVYNTKYVYVYDSTPDVVYVGYTPGYVGSYVYGSTIFYGTGWYYRPWISPYYYYPRFSTWGFNVSYNPWYGWGFGLSWSWGPFSVGYYSGGYWHRNHYWYQPYCGYWGPGRYRPYYHHRNNRYAYSNHRYDGRDRYDGRYEGRGYDNGRDRGDAYRSRSKAGNYNLYRNDTQRAKIASTRDRQMRTKDSYAGGNRKTADVNRQARVNTPGGKTQKFRTQPVSTADLRSKARNVRLEASNSEKRTAKRSYSDSATRTKRVPAKSTTRTGATDDRVSRKQLVAKGAAVQQPQQKVASYKQRATAKNGTVKGNPSQARTRTTTNRVTQPAASAKARTSRQATTAVAGAKTRPARQVSSRTTTSTRAVKPASTQTSRRASTPRPAPSNKSGSGSQKVSAPKSTPRTVTKQANKSQSKAKSQGSGNDRSKSKRSRKD